LYSFGLLYYNSVILFVLVLLLFGSDLIVIIFLKISFFRVINHPFYNPRTTDNDFSLLKLAKKVDFARFPHIRPICLPTFAAKDQTDVRKSLN